MWQEAVVAVAAIGAAAWLIRRRMRARKNPASACGCGCQGGDCPSGAAQGKGEAPGCPSGPAGRPGETL